MLIILGIQSDTLDITILIRFIVLSIVTIGSLSCFRNGRCRKVAVDGRLLTRNTIRWRRFPSDGFLALGRSRGGLGKISPPKPSDCDEGLNWGSGVSEGLLFWGSVCIGLTSVRLLTRGVDWADGLLVFGTGGGGLLLDRLGLPG